MAGSVIVRNISEMRRVWPDFTTASGHTLELDPGEETILLVDPGEVSFLSVRAVKEPKAAPPELPVLPKDDTVPDVRDLTPEVNASIS